MTVAFITTGLLLYIPISAFIILSVVIVLNILVISFAIYSARQGKFKNMLEKLGYFSSADFIKEIFYPRISVIPLILMFIAYNFSPIIGRIFFYLGFASAVLLLLIFFTALKNKTYSNLYYIIFYILLLLLGLVLNFLGLMFI